MRKKRRSDISKLVTASRDIWRMSTVYQGVKRKSKDPVRKGFYICELCKEPHEVIKIDHIVPIGKQPDYLSEFGGWLSKLFCGDKNLQAICQFCHADKSKEDRKK